MTQKIACFLPNLDGGGAERIALNLVQGFVERGAAVDLVLGHRHGTYLSRVPSAVRIMDLSAQKIRSAIIPLARYLRNEQPETLISHLSHANVAALLAKGLSRARTRLILVEHLPPSISASHTLGARLTAWLMKHLYSRAETIVAVSRGVAADLEAALGMAAGRVQVIYNPVVQDSLSRQAEAEPPHPWFFQGGPPVFVAVGRLTPQKGFDVLIEAFALLRNRCPCRLIILGEGPLRGELEALVRRRELDAEIVLPGFVENPYCYMKRAAAFVLSSRWEGLPTVLIEAMACGCPVIATDCPCGPREILEDGRHGGLVPVDDVASLSAAMEGALRHPGKTASALKRAATFSVEQAVASYLELIN